MKARVMKRSGSAKHAYRQSDSWYSLSMRNVVKVRIYPTPEQQALLAQSFGCARWWWNQALNLNNETYKATGKGVSRQDYNDLLPALKVEHPGLKDCYSLLLSSTAIG